MIVIVPFYILGLLQRFGPQHGYQIKKTIAEQLSDFTQIKLPTIYYHLEKMEKEGLLSASSEKPGSRPEKRVYTITAKGRDAFQLKLNHLLDFSYRPSFSSDGIFYFSEHLDGDLILNRLRDYIEKLNHAKTELEAHKREVLTMIPEEMHTVANIIFSHHQLHYQAELSWATETWHNLKKQEEISWQRNES